MTVVRNAAYTRSGVGIREQHNERKNESYYNADIQLERVPFNVHFKKCEGTYEQALDKLLADGHISTRGLKSTAKIIDEMIFDVNTLYFEERGGYDFAKQFYEEAYRLAVQEVGDERYILSAVMHADERNIAVSEEMGKDVYHYHLHVVYVPVVEKEIKWTKRCKDKDLVGKVKEVIQQVSHSKKCPRFRGADGSWINSYSLLQSRFYEHMKSAGFNDFERGEYKSTRKHLKDIDYKLKKDKERAAKLDKEIQTKMAKLEKIQQNTAVAKDIITHYRDIDDMAKPTKFGKKVELSADNWKTVSNLAKEGYLSRTNISTLREKLKRANDEVSKYKSKFENLWEETRLFREAMKRVPSKVKELLVGLIQRDKDERQKARKTSQIKRKRGIDYGSR